MQHALSEAPRGLEVSLIVEQNQRLQKLLEVQHSLGLGAQLARLIDVDPGPFHRRIVLNVGTAAEFNLSIEDQRRTVGAAAKDLGLVPLQ